MSRSHKLLDFYASKAWAILPESLDEMFRLYSEAIARKEAGLQLDVDAVAAKLGRPLDNTHNVTTRDGVAILPIVGPMFRYANIFTQLSGATSIEKAALDFGRSLEDPAVRAIVIDYNTPGGEADGTSEFAQLIAEARGKKPIVSYVGNLCASAGIWLASAGSEIVVNKAASLGSIGVVCSVCVHKDKNHIELVSSQSPNKRPNVETEGGRSQIQAWLDALADVFIASVAQNRDMSVEDVIENGGRGGLKVGQQAVDAGFADRLGTLEEVISELSSADSRTWKPKRKNLNSKSVLETRDKSDEGDLDMADEKKPTDAKDTQTDAVDLDKKIETGVSGFFKKLFSGEPVADTPPVKSDERVDAHAAELERLKAETEKANREAAEAKAQVTALQKQARTTRYEALAKDWAGEKADHVSILEHLAQSEGGEDSELFKGYVKQQNATAAQLKAGGLFTEIGAAGAEASTAYDEIQTKAKAAVEASAGKLTLEQAISEVTTRNPDLYKKYLAEQRGGAVAA